MLGNKTATCKIMKLNHLLTPYTKTAQNQLETPTFIESEPIKLLEANICLMCMLFDVNLSNIFLCMSSWERKSKAKINE